MQVNLFVLVALIMVIDDGHDVYISLLQREKTENRRYQEECQRCNFGQFGFISNLPCFYVVKYCQVQVGYSINVFVPIPIVCLVHRA